MIVRVNCHDNDNISKIKGFFEKFRFCNYYKRLDKYKGEDNESIKLWVQEKVAMEELFEKFIYNSESVVENDKIDFARYIENSIKDYTNLDVDVEILEVFSEKWENDEVLYYFLNADRYIVQ